VSLSRPTGGPSAQLKSERVPAPIEITPEGLTHPMMQLAVGTENNRKAWASLPGVFRPHKVDRIKSLASLLLTARPGGESVPLPVLALQYYGKGRVLYMGCDHTWRWRVHDDTNTYQRFWGGVIDFLSAGRLEKKRVLITTGGDTFDLRAEIHVRLEAYTRNFAPLEGKKFTVSMTPVEGGAATTHVLQGTNKPGIYEGTIQPKQTGTYDIAPEGDENDRRDWEAGEVAVKQIEVRLPEEEFRRPEANYQALRELLAKGDRFLTIQDFQSLAQKIRPSEEFSIDRRDFTWLNSGWNAAVFLGLLALLLVTEWIVRKLTQMM
jgi:hypothetical protein